MLIEYLIGRSTSVALQSNWIVRIDAKYVGDGHHYLGREVADIGVIIYFRLPDQTNRIKLAFLQSKRLHPLEDSGEEMVPGYSLLELLQRLGEGADSTLTEREAGSLTFTEESRY
jgi:hypothetical protein